MSSSFWKQMHVQESFISLALGFLVVVVSGILLFNFFTKRTAQEITDQPQPTVTLSASISGQVALQKTRAAPTSRPTIAPKETYILTPPGGKRTQDPTATPKAQPNQPNTKPGSTYTVQKNDTLWSIAQQTYGSGFEWKRIAQANTLTNPRLITVGQQLTLPDTDVSSIATTIPSTHTVVRGESLWTISIKYYGNGFVWPQIAQENNLTNPRLIHAGTVLKLPHPTATLNSGQSNARPIAAVVQR